MAESIRASIAFLVLEKSLAAVLSNRVIAS
jgi:hypothetical protein